MERRGWCRTAVRPSDWTQLTTFMDERSFKVKGSIVWFSTSLGQGHAQWQREPLLGLQKI